MKSIYDEALDIVTESLEEYDNSVIFNHNGLNLLKKALEQAQKQEKLLKLYKELISLKNDMFSYCEVVDDIYYYMAETETDLEEQIKEIENDK